MSKTSPSGCWCGCSSVHVVEVVDNVTRQELSEDISFRITYKYGEEFYSYIGTALNAGSGEFFINVPVPSDNSDLERIPTVWFYKYGYYPAQAEILPGMLKVLLFKLTDE